MSRSNNQSAGKARPFERSIAALLVCLLIIGMGNSMLFSVMPPLIRELGLSEFESGVIVATGALAFVITTPFWGRRSDRWGRKPVMLIGLLGYGAAFLVFGALAEASLDGVFVGAAIFWVLLFSRPLFLLLSSGTLPAAQAHIADVSAPEQRTAGMALLGAAIGIGFVLGPVAGGLLIRFGLVVPFYAVAAGAGLSALAMWFLVPRSSVSVRNERRPALKFWDPRLRLILLVGLALYTTFASMQQTSAFFLQDRLGYDALRTAETAGVALAIAALVMILVQGGFIPRYKPGARGLIIFGLATCGLSLITCLFVASPSVYFLACGLFGLGAGCAAPGYLAAATNAVSENEQGACAGLTIAVQGVAYAIGPLFGTGLYELQAEAPFAACAVICFGASGFALLSGLGTTRRTAALELSD